MNNTSCSDMVLENMDMECADNTGRRVNNIQFASQFPKELRVAKIIYNYKQKTDQQIKDCIRLEIDTVIRNNPAYRFKDSKSHFNKTGGIDLVLNFELA